jgi:magnesium-transporting ATPase (P-type)
MTHSSTPASDSRSVAARSWHTLEPDAALAALASRRDGLTDAEADDRLQRDGPNELPAAAERGALALFLRQFADFMIGVLFVAAAVAALIGESVEAAAILAIVALNAVLGFAQEWRAQKAMAALRALSAPRASVVRNQTRHAQTMTFTVLTFAQLAHVMAIRSERASLFVIGIFSNRLLLGAVVVSVALHLALIYTPELQAVFGTQALSPTALGVACALALCVFVGIEIEKWAMRHGWIYQTEPSTRPADRVIQTARRVARVSSIALTRCHPRRPEVPTPIFR